MQHAYQEFIEMNEKGKIINKQNLRAFDSLIRKGANCIKEKKIICF